MRKFTLAAAALVLFSLPGTRAFALDKDDEDALADTQKLMSDEQALKAFAKDNKDAQGALDQVDKMTGGNKQQNAEVNGIASDVFANMVKQNNGDSAAIMQQLQDGLKDPEKFMKSMPAADQARIKALEAQMEKNGQKNGEAPRIPASAQK
jgi:hypothetical protein